MIVFEDVTMELAGAVVLENVSFSLEPGELMALIGPSGAGKSALLKAACGLLPVASGTIHLAGRPLRGLSEDALFDVRRLVGMLFQQGALFDALTVFENVAFPLRRSGVPDDRVELRVTEELRRVGLFDAAELLPAELSGGMRKRVGIARALVTDPPVGLFDEPTAGLDPVTGARILRILRAACTEDDVTGIAVGHEIETLLPACDRVLMLHEGHLVFDGAPDEIGDAVHPAVRQFVTGSQEGPL